MNMFEQFMQMGGPASAAIIGMAIAVSTMVVAGTFRRQAERDAQRKFELDRLEVSAKLRLIEHQKGGLPE